MCPFVQRARLTAVTPVTLETFQAWKEQKILEKDMEQKKNRRRAEESYRRSGGGISGRDLFDMDASIFVDDEEGVDVYEFEMEGVDEDLFASEMEGMDLGEGSGIGSSSAPEDNFVSFYPEFCLHVVPLFLLSTLSRPRPLCISPMI